MGKTNPWKMGLGAASIFLGIYFVFNFKDIISIVAGIIFLGIGIGLISSS